MRGDTGQTPRSVASDLGLHCLLCPTKRALGLYGLNILFWCICAVQKTFSMEINTMNTAENHVTLED